MFRNYLLTALRNIARRKGYSLLNVLGLAIGLAASLLILQYVKDELSYDSFHKNGEDIYRIRYDYYQDGERVFQCATAFNNVATNMIREYPEISNVCRLYMRYGGGVVRHGDIAIKVQDVFNADQSFLDMFSYPLIAGDRNSALREPNTAVVEEQTAKKFFGDENPVGKRIRFGTREEYEITGVMQSPENSHLKFSFLFSYTTYPFSPEVTAEQWENSWGWYDFYNYIQLKPGADARALEEKFPAFVKKYGPEGESERVVFSMQHMPDIHLYSDLLQEARVNGSGRTVYFLTIIAFFILCIAWVNYINLATAQAEERAREVGVRKAIGAGRGQLMRQFLAEALLINLAAVLVALALVSIAIPVFNEVSGKQLSNSILYDVNLWLSLGALFVLGSVFSGLYPAIVLSGYQPVKVLKGLRSASRQGMGLRKVLVVFQFLASVALVAGTVIVYQQLQFMQRRDLGIDIGGKLVIHAPGVRPDPNVYPLQVDGFRNEMLRHPAVSMMAGSSEIPGNLIYWTNSANRIGSGGEAPDLLMYRYGVDHDFFATYGNRFVAGRGFEREFTSDSGSVVLNRKAVDVLGYRNADEAIGTRVSVGGDTLTVIGVVENYHQEGLKSEFRQTAFHLTPGNLQYFTLKIDGGRTGDVITYAREKFNASFPGNPFDYFFLDSFFNRQYKGDRQFGHIFGFFALLAICVACLGLFGLASFAAVQRTKEIGIRKVLGSTVANIFLLLSMDFLKLVLIANLIAIPLVWSLMDQWLNHFAFRIEISLWVFVIAAALTMLIALATVSFQSIRVAIANPVNSLRYE